MRRCRAGAARVDGALQQSALTGGAPGALKSYPSKRSFGWTEGNASLDVNRKVSGSYFFTSSVPTIPRCSWLGKNSNFLVQTNLNSPLRVGVKRMIVVPPGGASSSIRSPASGDLRTKLWGTIQLTLFKVNSTGMFSLTIRRLGVKEQLSTVT